MNKQFKEWVYYDGQCPMCIDLARKTKEMLNANGIGLAPLDNDSPQMLLKKPDGTIIGGADALIYLSRKFWWAYGFYLIAQIPGSKSLLRRIYRYIAKNRYCLSGCSL